MQLFRFLQAKDVFIKTYIENLADRLLNDQSKGGATELAFASILKSECGDSFASQTEQMISEI